MGISRAGRGTRAAISAAEIEDGSMPAMVAGNGRGLKLRPEHEVEPLAHRGRNRTCACREASGE